jgi:ectoine hydroxylase-related dioxygenase (phytanoyl-CoA dioxygenase family)
VRFLSAVFEDRPKAFQQLAFWNGSQQAMHKDTAYVKIDTNPLSLAATWLALEDVREGAGELEYYVGSHRAPDFVFGGISKWVEGFMGEHDRFLASLHEDAQRLGHRRATFRARAGDVLVWHADLAHGGSRITEQELTRRSLVTHFTAGRDEPFYRRHTQHAAVETGGCMFVSQYGGIAGA